MQELGHLKSSTTIRILEIGVIRSDHHVMIPMKNPEEIITMLSQATPPRKLI